MTRYWIDYDAFRTAEEAQDFPYDDDAVEVVKASDLPAHDAQLRAQVWEEAAMVAEGCKPIAHGNVFRAQREQADEIAAALRQRVGH